MFIVVGMECLLTATFVQTVCVMGQKPAALIVADRAGHAFVRVPHRHLIAVRDERVDETAYQYNIPLYRVHDWATVPDQFLMQFDTIVVVCYPTLLPAQRFTLLGIRALNVHPAPLPALRGPDPLFYTARGDVPATITIHQLDATYDTGDVLAAAGVHVPPGCDELQLIRIHAVQAAQLYIDVVSSARVAVPQQAGAPVGWAALPFAEAYTLDPEWPMERTQRFVAMTDARKHPYWVPGVRQWVHALDPEGAVQVHCADGVLRARA